MIIKDKWEIVQLIFLAFLVSVFIEIFDFFSWFYSTMLGYLSPFFGESIGKFTMVLLLVAICFFILWRYPKIMNIKDKEAVNLFKKIFIWGFIIFLILLIYVAIVVSANK
jgi:uncharacterized Tic20 family protein